MTFLKVGGWNAHDGDHSVVDIFKSIFRVDGMHIILQVRITGHSSIQNITKNVKENLCRYHRYRSGSKGGYENCNARFTRLNICYENAHFMFFGLSSTVDRRVLYEKGAKLGCTPPPENYLNPLLTLFVYFQKKKTEKRKFRNISILFDTRMLYQAGYHFRSTYL